jgi:hypothetical protein
MKNKLHVQIIETSIFNGFLFQDSQHFVPPINTGFANHIDIFVEIDPR